MAKEMRAPPGGLRFGGRNYQEGQRLPQRYVRLHSEERARDPAIQVPGAPPNFGRTVLPHVYTFSGLTSSLAKVYLPHDEAIRHSAQNAHMMLSDPMIAAPLFARQTMVALLNTSVESEDDKDPKLKAVADDLNRCVNRIKRFVEYKRWLLEAIWYGRVGVQHQFALWTDRHGQTRRVVKDWEPVSGDKIVFRFNDGTEKFKPGQVGVRVRSGMKDDALAGAYDLEMTGQGMAYFLKDWERSKFAIHRHMIRDGEYEDPRTAGSIHGVGIRSFLYWVWYQKQETMAQMVELIDRTGSGFTIYYYPSGNDRAKADIDKVAEAQGHTNIIKMPSDPENPDAYRIEQIPPNTAGLDALSDLIDNHFGDQILRSILGQTLSMKSAATGLGSGVADLHEQGLLNVAAYDAVNLEETLTTELLIPLVRLNYPQYTNVDFKLRISTSSSASDKEMQEIMQAWQMGAELRETDVLDRIGLSTPKKGERVLFNPQVKQAIMQINNPQPQPMPGTPPGSDPGADPSADGGPDGGGPDPGDDPAAPPGGDDKAAKTPDVSKLFGPILNGKPGQPLAYAKNDALREAIEQAAQAVDLEPSEAEKAAGNARKGSFWLGGWQVTIENPLGSVRRGDGWERTMSAHYGYIRRTKSSDGEHVDVFIGPDPESQVVYVVDQLTAGGRFDEVKVLIGFHDRNTALECYRSHYPSDWKVGPVVAMTMPQFKAWLLCGDTHKPISKQVSRYGKARSGVSRLVRNGSAMHQSATPVVSLLRRAGDNGMPAMERELPVVFTGYGQEAGDRQGVDARAVQQYQRLQPGELRLGNARATGKKQAQQPHANVSRSVQDDNGMGSRDRSRTEGDTSQDIPIGMVSGEGDHHASTADRSASHEGLDAEWPSIAVDPMGDGAWLSVRSSSLAFTQWVDRREDIDGALSSAREEVIRYARKKSIPAAGAFDWEEDKHPRAEDGKFAEKGAGASHSGTGDGEFKLDSKVPKPWDGKAGDPTEKKKQTGFLLGQYDDPDQGLLFGDESAKKAAEAEPVEELTETEPEAETPETTKEPDHDALGLAAWQHGGTKADSIRHAINSAGHDANDWRLQARVGKVYDQHRADGTPQQTGEKAPETEPVEPPKPKAKEWDGLPHDAEDDPEAETPSMAETPKEPEPKSETPKDYRAPEGQRTRVMPVQKSDGKWVLFDRHEQIEYGNRRENYEDSAAAADRENSKWHGSEWDKLLDGVENRGTRPEPHSRFPRTPGDNSPRLAEPEPTQPDDIPEPDAFQEGNDYALHDAPSEHDHRAAADHRQKQLDADYEFARASTIPNQGEDLKGSARHRVNAWKSLQEAEADGNGDAFATKAHLLKHDPHNLLNHADKHPLSALAMHYAINKLPAEHGYGNERQKARRTPEEKAKDREEFVAAYKAIKAHAEHLAETEPDPGKAVKSLESFIRGHMKELRSESRPGGYMNRYNATANGLVKTVNALDRHGATTVRSAMNEFGKALHDKHGGINDDNAADVAASAREHARDIIEGHSLNKTFGKKSDGPKRFDPSEAYVKHAERKGGRQLSAETANKSVSHLLDNMGMRGVQWGNSVTDDEREHHGPRAAEAFMDLMDAVGFDDREASLGGKLGLAIGARGHGSFSAHYEPGNQVINLTRKSGVGTLAHEWGHFFDHHLEDFATSDDGGRYFSETHDRNDRATHEGGTWVMQQRTGDTPLHKAYKAWDDSTREYRKRLGAALSERRRNKEMGEKAIEYWRSTREVFARCFERYVQDKIRGMGRENTYLTGLADTKAGTPAELWPNKEETAAMTPHFDAIFAAYKEHGKPETEWKTVENPRKKRYKRDGQPDRYAIRHAPAGGVDIQGKHFTGGQFIPDEDYANADPVTKSKIDRQTGDKPDDNHLHAVQRLASLPIGHKLTDPTGETWTKTKTGWMDASGKANNGRGVIPHALPNQWGGDYKAFHDHVTETTKPKDPPPEAQPKPDDKPPEGPQSPSGQAQPTAPPDPNPAVDTGKVLGGAPAGTKVGDFTKGDGDKWTHAKGSVFTTAQLIGHMVKAGQGDELNAAVDAITNPQAAPAGTGQPKPQGEGSKSPGAGRVDLSQMAQEDRHALGRVALMFGINPGDAASLNRAANFALLAARKLGLNPEDGGADKLAHVSHAVRFLHQQQPRLESIIETARKLGYKGNAQTLVARSRGAAEHIVKHAMTTGYQSNGQFDQHDLTGALQHLATSAPPPGQPDPSAGGPLPLPPGPKTQPGYNGPKPPIVRGPNAQAPAQPESDTPSVKQIVEALAKEAGGWSNLGIAAATIGALWFAFTKMQKTMFFAKGQEHGYDVIRYEE